MKEQLLDLFPEIKLIQDDGIREKTLNTLAEAVDAGGWTLEDLDVIPFTLLIKDITLSIRQHTRAVTQMAITCGKVMAEQYREYYQINFDHLVSGAILHDVGKLLEYEKTGDGYIKSRNGKLLRHPFSGAGLCTKHGLPDDIVHTVAVHAKEGHGGYRSPEATAVHHADFINFEPLREL